MSSPPERATASPLFPLSQVVPRLVAWLWLRRLALGKLAILDGDPGLGKSLLTLDLCARLTTGRPFPDETPGPGPANVIVLSGEDDVEDTITPRLRALGADLARVFTPRAEDGTGPLSFPSRLDALDRALSESRARLVVLDPVVAFLDRGIVSSNDQSVRRALTPLAGLAARHQCAVLLVRHLNKSGNLHSVYRGGGSIGFVGACRSAWLVARDPGDPDRRVLAQVKNNLAAPRPSLAFTLAVDGEGPPLAWLGASDLTADELLVAARPAARPRSRACDLLEELLGDGPRTAEEVMALTRERGLAERTVNRAKKDLAIQSLRVCLQGQRSSYWLLPGQKLPDSVPTSAIECDPQELLDRLPDPSPEAPP
jgi:hypothetical protein